MQLDRTDRVADLWGAGSKSGRGGRVVEQVGGPPTRGKISMNLPKLVQDSDVNQRNVNL